MSNQSTTAYLSTHEFFSGFSDGILKFLCECSGMCEIKKGQVLFRQGENADKSYVVRKGRISIQMPAIMEPTLEIQALGEDQVLGWSWLISPYKWNFQTMAEEDSELLMFDGTAILARCAYYHQKSHLKSSEKSQYKLFKKTNQNYPDSQSIFHSLLIMNWLIRP
jgi:CRP/FNR family transcriptional regulator, cyclic AMP receptor protein